MRSQNRIATFDGARKHPWACSSLGGAYPDLGELPLEQAAMQREQEGRAERQEPLERPLDIGGRGDRVATRRVEARLEQRRHGLDVLGSAADLPHRLTHPLVAAHASDDGRRGVEPCSRVAAIVGPRMSPLAHDPATRPPRRSSHIGTRVSDELEAWVQSDGDKTLGGLIDVFEKRAFAIVFVVLMGVPALPLPTGGATHVFEVIVVLLALQLIIGRDEIWLPRRWRARKVNTEGRFITSLLKMIRRLERISRPRLRFLFGHRLSNTVFGLLVAGGAIAAFLAPPFTGLDTLPALGVVLLSLGVLLEDFLLVAIGIVVGVVGVALEVLVGGAALRALRDLF